MVGEVEHTWTERVQVIRSESAAQSQAAALDRRLKQTEAAVRGLTPPVGPGRTRVHHRLGVGAGRQRAAGRAGGDGAVDGDLGAARDRPRALRGSRPRRAEAAEDDGTERPLSDHLGDARRRGDRTAGGADGLASAGDQRGVVAAVAGGFVCWVTGRGRAWSVRSTS